MSKLTIIVAATNSNGIGVRSRLPWRLPKELKYFANVTSGAPEGKQNIVIMGRNTWESIPKKNRPLPNRLNIVISRNPNYDMGLTSGQTALLENNLPAALAHLNSESNTHRGFIMGGASLYRDTLTLHEPGSAMVDRILLTSINSPEFECDVFMPDFRHNKAENGIWTKTSHANLQKWVDFDVPEGLQNENGVEYEFQMWMREL